MKILAWGLKLIAVPLIPFFGVAIIRAVASDADGIKLFQPTEIAFAMFLLSVWILLAATASRMNKLPHVQSVIQSVALIVIVGYLGIFFITSFKIEQSLSYIGEDVEELDEVLRTWKTVALNSPTATIADLYAGDRRVQIDDYIKNKLKIELEELVDEDRLDGKAIDISAIIQSLLESEVFIELEKANQSTPEDIEKVLRRELDPFVANAFPDDPPGDSFAKFIADEIFGITETDILQLALKSDIANDRSPDLGGVRDWRGLRVITFVFSALTILAAVGLQWRYDLSESGNVN